MVALSITAGIDYSIPICYILKPTRGDGGPFYTAGIDYSIPDLFYY